MLSLPDYLKGQWRRMPKDRSVGPQISGAIVWHNTNDPTAVRRVSGCRATSVVSGCLHPRYGGSMKLSAVTVQKYRNFVDPQRIEIEDDVTCLVGKNESGKTTILKALHRLNPANGEDTKFDLTTEYPRWRLSPDRKKNPKLSGLFPITAEFVLSEDECAMVEEAYGVVPPEGTICHVARNYANEWVAWALCTVPQAVSAAAAENPVGVDDLAELISPPALAVDGDAPQPTHSEIVAGAKAKAKELKDQGDIKGAKSFTAFAAALDKYAPLITYNDPEGARSATLKPMVPKFFYFSNYDTLPGETDLTNLAARIAQDAKLTSPERTVVALLAHADEQPSDFLDDNYDSRKAELQAVSSDLSTRVFAYWKQNPDLSVVFDTDNRVFATDPAGNQTAHRFLKIELRDGRHGGVETNFNTRSTGFQWFFSFFAAFSEYQDSDDPVVVLLDEPGTSLHGDAQREFVDYIFKELGASKQTIYTTHSQHMVDPTRYEKLRAVHDRATRENPNLGVVVTLPSLTADKATILPIESALGYSLSQHLFLGSGQHLAVEGSSDFVYLQRMTEHLTAKGKQGLDPRLAMIPVGGADNMPAFIALLGRRLKVSALIDGDRSSNRVARMQAAAKDNSVPHSAIVLCSDVANMPKNADIEDLFATQDYLRLYNWALKTDLAESELTPTTEPILRRINVFRGKEYDHALPAHALTQYREEFIATVNPATVANFEAIFALLNSTVIEAK